MSEQVSEKLSGIVEAIEGLTVVELVELVDALKDKLGLSDADLQGGGGVVMAPGGAGGEAAAEEEPTEFNVTLKGDGGNKIQCIKVVRAITGQGLADAKKFVEGLPQVIKEGASKEEVDELKAKFDEIGAELEVKGA
ncbi:MAG: 50S ribosomal protein L7/L12 [Planctomycetota bacterium]